MAATGTADYTGYAAKTPANARGPLYRLLRSVYRFLKHRVLYGTLLYPYGMMRHRALLRSASRSQNHTYTCFFRSPAQLEALTGPVLEFVLGTPPGGRRLQILQFACSNGAEAYTMASALLQAHPTLEFSIVASDLHQEMVEKAIAARYSRDEVFHSEYMTDALARATFDRDDDGYHVKPAIRGRVAFRQANLLDPELARQFDAADIVVAQNVLFHLDQTSALAAFDNILRFLKPRSALLIEGMDLDMKESLTRTHRLQPLRYKCREIYEQARIHIPLAWWRYYYGMEPYSILRRDRFRRYASVFTRALDAGA
jgi:chemotaxis methyl-accepting protein methylase